MSTLTIFQTNIHLRDWLKSGVLYGHRIETGHNQSCMFTESRRGRSYPDARGNVVVEGVREADDFSDLINYRDGKFVNNVFVPDFVGGDAAFFYLKL